MLKKSLRKRIRYFLFIFWTAVVIWMFFQMQATGYDDSILQSNSSVMVENSSEYIKFIPVSASVNSGYSSALLFYPGALVQAEAYAPYARQLAEKGYPVIIQKIPFRLAFTEKLKTSVFEKTVELFSSYPDSVKWVLAGHSKGGAMASDFSSIHPEEISGLLLIGTSHPREVDLTSLDIPITKVYGSEDGLSSVKEVEDFSVNLPEHTSFVLVEGGNHSQFGYYGIQLGSGTASISQENQQRQLLDASLELLLNLN
ncbi:MAG: alpha/beta hydrolase [Balneola sp.]|nr:MAG: alpha/beta hydrolase [Balneola sp.]